MTAGQLGYKALRAAVEFLEFSCELSQKRYKTALETGIAISLKPKVT